MKVTQEKLPASQLGLEIEITPEMSKQAYEKTVREFARTVNIPGFRKGKVPRQVLIQRLGSVRIKMAVLEDLIDTGVRQAVDQEKIEAIGNFQLRSSFDELTERFEPGKALTFSAAVDVPPGVDIQNYSGLSFKAEEVTYDASKVDDILEDYRNRVATLVPVEERAVQMGDIAIVDFSGTYIPSEGADSTDIPGGSAQDFQLEMKEGQFIEGFVEGVVGMGVGESKELNLTFPEGYPQEDLAGKPAVFSITLKELKEKELPDLDDDFAQEVSEFETLQELRETLEKRFQDEAEQKTKDNKNAAIFEELLKHIEVELPESMIKREVDFLVTQTVMRLENQGLDIRKTLTQELVEGMRDRARPEAVTRLKRTLGLGEIAKRESIGVSNDELEAKIQEFMQTYKEQDVDPERVRKVLEDELLEDKVLEWLETNGTFELVPEGTLTTDETDSSDDSETPPEESIQDVASEASSDVESEAAEVDTSVVVDVEASPVEDVPSSPDEQPVDEQPVDELEMSDESMTSKEESSSKKKAAKTSKSTKSKKTSTEAKKSSKKDDTDTETAENSES